MTLVDDIARTAECPVASWSMAALLDYVGQMSDPSKMPGKSYGIPASECKVGTRLRSVDGSTCEHCYAFERGAYAWRGVKAAYRRRFERLDLEWWSEAMAEILNRRAHKTINGDVFRWHDSGDVQSLEHLCRIVRVCELTPDVSHWLPTREYRIVQEYVDTYGPFPANLNVRLSAHMIGGHVPTFPRLAGSGVTVSTVSRDGYPDAHTCPAPKQDNACGDCRACWNRDVVHVDYHLH